MLRMLKYYEDYEDYEGLKALLKRNIFKRFLKSKILSQFLTIKGREFHNFGPACANCI